MARAAPARTAEPEPASRARSRDDVLRLGDLLIDRGTAACVRLPLSAPAWDGPAVPSVVVLRGRRPGPRVLLTAGIHGDEVNGVHAVRLALSSIDPDRLAGDLIGVPVVNVSGFVNHSRYLPDGSDLNRFFPGSPGGPPVERLADALRRVVSLCDFGMDFHTAARGRANVAHVRADMDRPETRALARAFGTTIILHRRGHVRSLRRVATESGMPMIAHEAGATGGVESKAAESGVRGVRNVLAGLGMLPGAPEEPPFRVIVRSSRWLRARRESDCELAVRPGDLVYEGQRIGTSADRFGFATEPILSPFTGLVVGVSLRVDCDPGSPLCHIVRIKRTLSTVERHLQGRPRG